MPFVRPNTFTTQYYEEFDENRPVSEETIRKLIYNFNMLRALLPYAQVVAYHVNISGVKIPNPDFFAYCDGSEITATSSPLNGAGPQNTPDMVARYLRGGNAGTTLGNEAGGVVSIDWTHTHSIGGAGGPGYLEAEGDNVAKDAPFHNHGLDSDGAVRAIDIAHFQIAFYLRVDR